MATAEELAEFTADKLSKLSTQELEVLLAPYFNVTRPERVVKQKATNSVQVAMSTPMSTAKKRALELMKQEGLDLSFLSHKSKKKG